MVSRTGIGELNAACATALGIREFHPRAVLNQGIAGAHREDLRVGDLVVGERVAYLNAWDTPARGAGEGSDPFSWAPGEGAEVLPICAQMEADIAELDDPDEKAMFMEELGLKQSGLDRLIQASYELLGLISFLTAGSDECRAWTIKKGTRAPQAAGKIHSDFERGFIRAEVIAFDDLKACGTMAAAKAKGLVRSEGKEYVMKDGDIVNFLFNV